MPNHCSVVSYRYAEPDQILPGRLVGVGDMQEDHLNVYLHPLHARRRLCRDMTDISRHQIGHGLWWGWMREDGIRLPVDGFRRATVQWEIVPAAAMPRDRVVVTVEEEGVCTWLIREGYITPELRDEMNEQLKRVDSGLWLQGWPHGRARGVPLASPGPVLAAPLLPVLL